MKERDIRAAREVRTIAQMAVTLLSADPPRTHTTRVERVRKAVTLARDVYEETQRQVREDAATG